MSDTLEAAPIQWRIPTWFSDLSPEELAKLKTIKDCLVKANKSIALVSAKAISVVDAIHFADSILASREISKNNKEISHLYDLSTGNGFPGLIFAALHPKIKVTVVDFDVKRLEYLHACATEARLSNVLVMNSQIESIQTNLITHAVTRGVGNISKMLMLTRKCIEPGGTLYHMKGEEWTLEVSQIPSQLCSYWTPSLIKEYKLPIGEVRFSLVKTDKIA